MYCQIRLGILYCSAVFFYCCFDFSKQHFTKDNNEKKSHGRRNETTLYLLLKTCRKFNHKWEHQTSTSLRGSFLFRGSREKSRESSTRKETRERGAGWEARSLAKGELASRLKFNSCLARYSFSSQFRSIANAIHFHHNFAVYKLYWLLILYFHFNSDLERSEVASNRILKQIGNPWK